MQANSIKPEPNSGIVNNPGNDPGNDVCLPEHLGPSNQALGAAQSSGNNNQAQTQQNQQQQHLRPPTSPAQGQHHQPHLTQHQLQQQQQSAIQNQHMSNHNHGVNPNLTSNHHHMAPNVHQYAHQSGPGGYHQRQAYHGHHQQMQQQYHQSNKYNGQRGDNESDVNHVLLITVINPHYTITHDLIHQICSTYGKVNRIVIFRKNGVQAMVEFDNVDSAKRAKTMLNGCDIYSGCCTLRIEFAKPTRLNIHKNDSDSFDYTNPNLDSGQQDSSVGWTSDEQAQLQTNNTGSLTNVIGTGGQNIHQQSPHQSHTNHHRSGRGAGRGGGGHHGGSHFHQTHHPHNPSGTSHHHVQPPVPMNQMANQTHQTPNYNMVTPLDQTAESVEAFHQDASFNVSRDGTSSNQPQPAYADSYLPNNGGQAHTGVHNNMYPRQDGHVHQQHHARSNASHSASFTPANATNALMSGQSNLGHPQGYVVMVYGLQPERLNCDRLFNLFCLYGNVARVKFLRTKEGCAMVQMGDVIAADRCMNSLNKITLFDSEIQISYSKQAFIHDVIQPFILPDGSPSFKDFTTNKNNRFKNPEVASKNRILPPSQVLHFFNAPLGISEDELVHLFKQNTGHEPVSVKIFTPKGRLRADNHIPSYKRGITKKYTFIHLYVKMCQSLADNIKSYSGLVTFKDPAEATEALVICNHMNMPKPGAPHPYILRLCFSPPTFTRPAPSYPPAPNQ